MSLLAYFKATLPCMHCRHVGTAWIPSRLGSRGETYEAGSCPGSDIPLADLEDTSLTVRTPEPSKPIHVLLSWTCEECARETFAEIVLADGCVRSIDAIQLDSATLDRLHFIAEGLTDMLEAIMGVSVWTESGLRDGWLRCLREALSLGERW